MDFRDPDNKDDDTVPPWPASAPKRGVSLYLIAWLLDLQALRQYDVALEVVQVIKRHFGADPLDMAAMNKYETALLKRLAEQQAALSSATGSKGGQA